FIQAYIRDRSFYRAKKEKKLSDKAERLEKEAYVLFSDNKYDEAFRLFKEAAEIYSNRGGCREAALCFASAASCWSKKSGETTFYNAAYTYEKAANEAKKYGDFGYAALLYKYAAINHERDGEFFNFSDCFYNAKESHRSFFKQNFLKPTRILSITQKRKENAFTLTFKSFFLWLLLTFSFLIWGHGERPLRTFFTAIAVILLSAFFYSRGYLYSETIFKPVFWEALYFSMITFSTVGYGDIVPLGFSRVVALLESFSGIFIMPLFVIALSRRYLRV
ncbi:MAG: hypothetical protein GF375_02575, partial [Candidatus Omnitrophica bacterium]|nr:hypothetical protein [Candidatus Omnitrophota bacterium]MBD3268987.1 hypothetical protein [Candidatus Omnitrophota bacterium]